MSILDLLRNSGLLVSSSQGRRFIAQGAVRINGELVDLEQTSVEVKEGDKLALGRREVTVTKDMLQ